MTVRVNPVVRPAQQPCRMCDQYDPRHYCRALDDTVQPQWTGCIRWVQIPDRPNNEVRGGRSTSAGLTG